MKYSQHEIEYALKLLNNMSIKRKEKSVNNFENIGAILLSANSKILKIANNDNIKEQGKVPLATNIDFLTNKFWFKLGKGFGTNDYPKTFSIFTKAQIVLSSHINENLNNQFTKIQKNIKNDTLTEDLALKNLVFLKENVKKPEDITSESIDEIYLLLNENSIEEIVNHHEYLKVEVEKQKSDKLILQEELKNKTSNINEINEKFRNLQEKLIIDQKEKLEELEKKQEKLDFSINKKLDKFKYKLIGTVVTYYVILIVLIIIFGWDLMEPIAYAVGLLPFGIGLIYFLFFEKKFSYEDFIQNKKNSIEELIYRENDYDKNTINNLKEEIRNTIEKNI